MPRSSARRNRAPITPNSGSGIPTAASTGSPARARPGKDDNGRAGWVSGVYYEISERKALEARLLALNETLEARIAELREEARTLEVLNRTGTALAAELSLERLVQTVTDAARRTHRGSVRRFLLQCRSTRTARPTRSTRFPARRARRSRTSRCRATRAVFEPTFRGEGPVRSDDILADPRYGQNPPYNGMPPGHLPVRSYLAVPVVSRSGEVIGGLFFGHSRAGRFHRARRADRDRHCGAGRGRDRQCATL